MNHGQGLVIVTTEKYLKGAFEEGLKISDEPSDLGTFEIEQMPEKGGFGVVATRKLEKVYAGKLLIIYLSKRGLP
ncbi:hypothetical protein PtA15_2A547 [Puccinia triticina]|uniref:Uncharacterized protein n=1 Tax=Puccinia triticina TaxID=208348 RepID=A0ABY7CBU1_9BASI|nr:uncharacterized protein PtA15_2A547 [Puccinia triticina]WAQ82230.1 hypothetical protein PtA15_2A547 [Puccinia triticina]